MKIRLSNILALIAVFATLSFVMVSCSSNSEGEDTTPDSEQTSGNEEENNTPEPDSDEPEMMASSVTVSVDGMTCSKGCVSAIESHLSGKDGIASCSVDYENKTCTIEYDSNVMNEEGIVGEFANIGAGTYTAAVSSEMEDAVEDAVEGVEDAIEEVEAEIEEVTEG